MRRALSIRTKLLLLALLATLPALGLALYSGLAEERRAVSRTETQARAEALDLTQRQQRLIASTRQFLATLAMLPQVRRLDGKAAAPLFRELLAANPIYSDIVLSSVDGRILASARAHPPSANLSGVPYFREVLRTRDFTVGGYRKSITTGLDILVCAHPVPGGGGRLAGVISTGLRLSIFDDIVSGLQLPDGATVFMADQNGIRLFNRHYPDPRPDLFPIGKPLGLAQQRLLADAPSKGSFYTEDLRGVRRLYAVYVSRLPAEGGRPTVYVGVSVPERAVVAAARREMFNHLGLLAAAAMLAGLGAWIAGRHIFVRRVERLARMAVRFAAGDLSARAGLAPGGAGSDELDQLALAMDRIGEQLSAREAERETTLARMARTQYAVDNAGNEIYWADAEGRLVYVNRRAAASLGYAAEELSGRMVFDIDADIDPEGWRRLWNQLRDEGPRTIETTQRARSGELKAKELSISLVEGDGERLVYASGHDVGDRKRQEAVLRSLLDDTASATGEEFFHVCTERLKTILGVTAAFIGVYEGDPPERVRTLSFAGVGDAAGDEFPYAESPGRLIPDDGRLLIERDAAHRRPGAEIFARAGMESYLGVPMRNAAGRRIGHLSVMDVRPMDTDPGLVSTLRLFAQRASAEVMRLRAEGELRASLHEKEVLLKEIHHRVKNNLQIVSSLLSLQARDVTDPTLLDLLAESRARILSMALVHEDLYQSGNLASVDFRHYIEKLVARTDASSAGASGVRIECDLDELSLSIDRAVPLGLACNELLTNALKHAFPPERAGGPNTVRVTLRVADGMAELTVRDNGRGLPGGFDPAAGGTLGMELVWSLAGQLRGTAEAENDGGAVFTLRFPVVPPRRPLPDDRR